VFTDDPSVGSKILYAPVGYTVAGLDRALAAAVNSKAWFSYTFNRECRTSVKTALRTDYRFERTVDLGLPLLHGREPARRPQDRPLPRPDVENPAELNRQENAYSSRSSRSASISASPRGTGRPGDPRP
jgi:hypothetical protein